MDGTGENSRAGQIDSGYITDTDDHHVAEFKPQPKK